MVRQEQENKVDMEDSQVEGVAPGESEQEVETEEAEKELPLEEMSRERLMEEIRKKEEAALKNMELYIRSQAEIENMKKRFKKEKEEWVKYSHDSMVKELLPVVDNLEKALGHAEEETSVDALRDGVQLTLTGLKEVLRKAGVEEIKAEGEPFDPQFHQAVSEKEDDTVDPGTVVAELQKGYLLNGRLARPSMVIVSKRSNEKAENGKAED